MIVLREMTIDDLALFKKWLYLPHVATWYHEPLDWIEEVEKQNDEYCWLHHFIVEDNGKPIGFCQYYACQDSGESWGGYTKLGGTYSVDYLIGNENYLKKGFGRQILQALIDKVKSHSDAKRIVVEPEPENMASCGLLVACGFDFDQNSGIYIKKL